MDKQKRLLLMVGVLVIAAIFVVIAMSVSSAAKPAVPTPTPLPPQPTPTAAAEVVTCLGGQVFIPMAHDHILETYNIDLRYKGVSTFMMKDYEHLDQIDCIWPGSASAMDFYKEAHPSGEFAVRRQHTVFRTYGVIFTRRDLYLEPLMKAGYVYEKDGAYVIKMAPIVQAMSEDKLWTEIGVDAPGEVNIGYSDPESSSGGLQHLFLLGSYMLPGSDDNVRTIKMEDLGLLSDPDSVLSLMKKNWDDQPRQDTASPSWFDTYLSMSSSYVLAASSESLYLGWYNELPEGSRETEGNKIVGLYPEWTVVTDHVLGSLTEDGDRVVEIFQNDLYLRELGWTGGGMRTAVGLVGGKPGNTDVSWILADPLAVGEPKKEVFDAVKAALAGE